MLYSRNLLFSLDFTSRLIIAADSSDSVLDFLHDSWILCRIMHFFVAELYMVKVEQEACQRNRWREWKSLKAHLSATINGTLQAAAMWHRNKRITEIKSSPCLPGIISNALYRPAGPLILIFLQRSRLYLIYDHLFLFASLIWFSTGAALTWRMIKAVSEWEVST